MLDQPDLAVEVLAPRSLAGRFCFVTGAGSGIGRAIALRLASLGALVFGVGRRVEALEQTAALAAESGGSFAFAPCNVRDIPRIEALVLEVGGGQGIDLLVNNAGGQFYAPATAISRNGWDSVIDLNLSAVFTLFKAAYPHLKRRRGGVVSISLTGVDRGLMGASHSVAARAGVLALSRTLALEWAGDGIRLNCIGPGAVFTEGLSGVALEKVADSVAAVPLGRGTQVGEIAELTAFLATDAARMITGTMLQIDGGAHIGPGLHAPF